MAEPHQGEVQLRHSFNEIWNFVKTHGEIELETEREKTPFEVNAKITRKGSHKGEPLLLFTRDGKDRARCYPCCWGYYHNCSRTRIGMYCSPLDSFLSSIRI